MKRFIQRTAVSICVLLSIGGIWLKHDGVAASERVSPELPRVYLETAYIEPAGAKITVRAGDDLQTAINAAQPGDLIELQAGAVFTGNFVLPKKRGSRSGSRWVTIRTSSSEPDFPAPGSRVKPSDSILMPKLVSPNTAPAVETAAGASHYRLIGLEVTLAPDVFLNYGIVVLGEGGTTQNQLEFVPEHLIIDRCYIHGTTASDVSRGIALNSAATAVVDSYISECHGMGFDAQAICGWNGPGPFKIVNNYLEGSGENVLFGGADPAIEGLVPSDIEFRTNHCAKPPSWRTGALRSPLGLTVAGIFTGTGNLTGVTAVYYRVAAVGHIGSRENAVSAASEEVVFNPVLGQDGVELTWSPVPYAREYRVYRTADTPELTERNWSFTTVTSTSHVDIGNAGIAGRPPTIGAGWTVKNIFELKNASRVLIDGNLFENNWVDAQNGYAILFTVRNQDGRAPWSVVEDVTFKNNLVRNVSSAINILGEDYNHPSERTKRIRFSNNLFYGIEPSQWGGGHGAFVLMTSSPNAIAFDHNTVIQSGHLILADGEPNHGIFFTNNLALRGYGIFGGGFGEGNRAIEHYFPDFVFKKNVTIGAPRSLYPAKKNFYPASIDEVRFVDKENKNYRLSDASPYRHAGSQGNDIGANIDAIEAAISAASGPE